ncbi:MAG: nucleotidyltransferase family protein [Chloroflexi bacterium]|nr:nucleotidyltransferase family protein [Chloroflexota bacterium]
MAAFTLPFDTGKLIEICRKNDVAMIGVFGSVARGQATPHSDIDLLVRFSKQKSLLGLASLAIQIEEAIGRKVDLLTEAGISPYIRDRVKRDLKVIYESVEGAPPLPTP